MIKSKSGMQYVKQARNELPKATKVHTPLFKISSVYFVHTDCRFNLQFRDLFVAGSRHERAYPEPLDSLWQVEMTRLA